MRFWTLPYSFVALLVAALVSEWKWVITELFRSWPERQGIVAQQAEWILGLRHHICNDGTRTEQKITIKVTLCILQWRSELT